MARRTGPSAKTIKVIESLGKKPQPYKHPGETRYRKVEAELSVAVESTALPCLLALFKDCFKSNEFERLMYEAFLITFAVADIVFYSISRHIPPRLHKFVMSLESKKRVQQLIESASIAAVLSQGSVPDNELPPERWKSTSLLTRYVALVELYWALYRREQHAILYGELSNTRVDAAKSEELLRCYMDECRLTVDQAYQGNIVLTGIIQQRIFIPPEKQPWPVCIQRRATQSFSTHKINKYITSWLKDFRVWSRDYDNWRVQRVKSREWCPEIWKDREKLTETAKKARAEQTKIILEPVVMAPSSVFDLALQRAIVAEPDITAWPQQEGYGILNCAPGFVSRSDQARKKGGSDWLVAYEDIGTLPKKTVVTPSAFSELLLDLIDITYYHWSIIGKPPSFVISDAELFQYRGKFVPDVGERSIQRAAMQQLQQFRFFHKKRKCDGERLLRCIALTVPGRTGKFNGYVYYVEILGLWRRPYEKAPGLVVVHGAPCLQKLWAQSGRNSLVRQLIRYLRAEWRWNARLYALDKKVRYRSWREILEQSGVVLETIGPRHSEFYSRLAIALTSLYECGFIKAWMLASKDKKKPVKGRIYKRSNTSDKSSSEKLQEILLRFYGSCQ